MADRDTLVKCRESPGHGWGRVPVYEDQVRSLVEQHRFQGGENTRGREGQGLRGRHEVEIVIGDHTERLEHPVEHRSVLPRYTQASLELDGALAEMQEYRAHLDRFGPCAEDKQDPDHRDPPELPSPVDNVLSTCEC